MAKKIPVIIWIIKHNPSNDPKFHQADILERVGKSIILLLIILVIGKISIDIFIRMFDVRAHILFVN